MTYILSANVPPNDEQRATSDEYKLGQWAFGARSFDNPFDEATQFPQYWNWERGYNDAYCASRGGNNNDH